MGLLSMPDSTIPSGIQNPDLSDNGRDMMTQSLNKGRIHS